MEFPRNEIWERKAYESLIKKGKLKVFFRPENRICDSNKKKCFIKGEEIRVRVLEKPGDDDRNIEPVFSNLVRKAVIEELKVVNINSLNEEDFMDSYPNVKDAKSLAYHLALIYNKDPNEFKEVTKIKIRYLN